MKKEIVAPLDNKKENFYVIVSIIIILIFSISLVLITRNIDYEKTIAKNEISSFENFNSIESNIYSDLYNFSIELEVFALHEGYSDIDTLNNDGIYPFVKDELWESKGKFNWYKLEEASSIYYLGISGDSNVGNFILKSEIVNDKVNNEIYYFKGKVTDVSQLMSNREKFKKIVVLTGNDINTEKGN